MFKMSIYVNLIIFLQLTTLSNLANCSKLFERTKIRCYDPVSSDEEEYMQSGKEKKRIREANNRKDQARVEIEMLKKADEECWEASQNLNDVKNRINELENQVKIERSRVLERKIVKLRNLAKELTEKKHRLAWLYYRQLRLYAEWHENLNAYRKEGKGEALIL